MYQGKRTVSDFDFIDSQPGRLKSSLIFASIFRAFYEHPDWSQLYAFFTKRYSRRQMLVDRDARRFVTPDSDSYDDRGKTTFHFQTDPGSVGLPRDFVPQLAAAGHASRGRMLGPDPLPTAIGPAIAIGVGAAGYMDLTYSGQPPGKYPEQHRLLYAMVEFRDSEQYHAGSDISTAKKGGRSRCWAEWAEIWSVVLEWVREYDTTAIETRLYKGVHSFKGGDSDKYLQALMSGGTVPRDVVSTDAIDAAEIVREVFGQLAAEPTKFQGIEWDFLEMKGDDELQQTFYSRFAHKDPGVRRNLELFARSVTPDGWEPPSYDDVSPAVLKPCPDTTNGIDWERWMLSIEGGDVAVARSPFQVSGCGMIVKTENTNIIGYLGYYDALASSSSHSYCD